MPKAGQKASDLDYTSRWVFLAVMLAATAAFVWLIYIAKARSAAQDYRDVPLFEIAVTLVALTAWALALPDSPAVDFAFYGGWFPPVVLALATALIPVVASALGKTPPTYEEQAEEAEPGGGA